MLRRQWIELCCVLDSTLFQNTVQESVSRSCEACWSIPSILVHWCIIVWLEHFGGLRDAPEYAISRRHRWWSIRDELIRASESKGACVRRISYINFMSTRLTCKALYFDLLESLKPHERASEVSTHNTFCFPKHCICKSQKTGPRSREKGESTSFRIAEAPFQECV